MFVVQRKTGLHRAAFAALTGRVHLESVTRAIQETFPGKIGAANVAAATEAHDIVMAQQSAASAA